MINKGRLYIILAIITIISIVVLEYYKPKEINWFPSYAKQHKIPFGTFIFHEQLERLFTKNNVIDVDRPPFEYLKTLDSIKGTYVFINNNLNFGEAELDELLNWTAKGNTLFIASEVIDEALLDTLNINISTISNFENINNYYQFQLKHKKLKHDSLFLYDKANYIHFFNEIDTLKASVISVVDNASDAIFKLKQERINTIKQSFGEGTIILSVFPQAFTNYFILSQPNQKFSAGLLSYIDSSQPIYVDNHYKSGKTFYTSPLYIMLNNKELRWAYYILLIGVLIYVIFDGKRKQRAIPVIKPLRNQTIDFTRTIANMYYEKGKHKEIVHHKILHFLEYIRTHFHLNTSTFDTAFIKNLAARSNNTVNDTTYLFETIKDYNIKSQINKTELEKLNALIETFKSKNAWKTKT